MEHFSLRGRVWLLSGWCCLGLLLAAVPAHGDTHVWAGIGLTGNWSIPANWAGNNPPAVGEAAPTIIVFPAGTPRPNNTNNIAGLVIDQIAFSGTNFTLEGSGAGANLLFRGNTYNITSSGTGNVLGGSLTIILSNTVPFAISGDLTIRSHLVGPGGFSLAGGGSLTLNALTDNQFTGAVSVVDGTLYLQNGAFVVSTWMPTLAVPGALSIGGNNLALTPKVVLLADAQIATNSPVSFNPTGYLLLNGHSNTVGSVTMTGGSLYGNSFTNSAIGTLGLRGGITSYYTPLVPSSAVSAKINLNGATRTIDVENAAVLNLSGVIDDGLPSTSRGSAGLTKTGPGTLNLFAANTYNGTTLVSAGTLGAYNNSALGATNLGTTISAGANLFLGGGISVSAEPLTLNGAGPSSGGALTCSLTNAWSGPITLASDSVVATTNQTDYLTLAGVLSGPGGITKNGGGTVVFGGLSANTYTGNTYVNAGTLQLDCGYFIGIFPNLTFVPAVAVPGYLELAAGPSSAQVTLLADAQLATTTAPVVHSGGTLHLNNHSTLCGPITLDGGFLRTGTGTLTMAANLIALSPNASSIIGNLSLGGATRQFDVQGNGTLFANCSISDGAAPAGIAKTGTGDFLLNVNNTYSGPTTIYGGAAVVSAYGALGTGANGGVTVKPNGILTLANSGLTISNLLLTLDGQGSTNGGTLRSAGSPGIWAGPVVVASDSTLDNHLPTSYLMLAGPITGPGGLRLTGGNTIYFNGSEDNTFTGTVTITSTNSLMLAKDSGAVALSGPVVIGDNFSPPSSAALLLGYPNQIANNVPILVNPSGLLVLNGNYDTIGSLTMYGGKVAGPGELTLEGDIYNYGQSVIGGTLSLGGQSRTIYSSGWLDLNGPILDGGAPAGITTTGAGAISLNTSNAFSGTLLADNEVVWVNDPHALGKTQGGTVLTNGATLGLTSLNIIGEPLVIGGEGDFGPSRLYLVYTNTWSGPIQLADDAEFDAEFNDSLFTVPAPISGPGNLQVVGSGIVRFSGTATNTFTGQLMTVVTLLELARTNAVAVSGDLAVYGGTVRYRTGNQIADAGMVEVDGTLDLNSFSDTIGDLMGSGSINLGSGILAVGGASPLDGFSGNITGPGGEFDKIGTNTLILYGSNTYSSATMIKGGTLVVEGTLATNSDVYIFSGATLSGRGTIGNLYAMGGAVSPGNPIGTLNCRNVTFNSGSSLNIDLNGTNPLTGYDQLNVTGTVTLNSGVNLNVNKMFTGSVSNQYVIIANDGADITQGIFSGLGDGATFTAKNTQFLLRYYGGSPANDVVLTQLSLGAAAAQFTGASRNGGAFQLAAKGTPNVAYQVLANTNLTTTNWTVLGTATANGSGVLQFTDPQATNYSRRFYKLLLP